MSAVAKRLPAKTGHTPVLKLGEARAKLARAETIEEVSVVHAQAEVVRAWARAQKKILKRATLGEVEQIRAEAEKAERDTAEVMILAEARWGSMLPAQKPGRKKKGEKWSQRWDHFSKSDRSRFRQLADLAPKHLRAYLANTKGEVSRSGFLSWCARRRKEAEKAKARAEAVAEIDDGVRAAGEPDPGAFADAPASPYQGLADRHLQAIKICEAERKKSNELDVFGSLGDEVLAAHRSLAARTAELDRDWRESHS